MSVAVLSKMVCNDLKIAQWEFPLVVSIGGSLVFSLVATRSRSSLSDTGTRCDWSIFCLC